jgi:hypothetical protein
MKKLEIEVLEYWNAGILGLSAPSITPKFHHSIVPTDF